MHISGHIINLPRRRSGFTLVELLIVITIMAALLALAGFAVSGLKRAGSMSSAIAGITAVVDEGRAYAMANDTYVYVGMMETDAAVSESASSQTPAAGDTGGRLFFAVVATRDGTKGYTDPAVPAPLSTDNLSALGGLRIFDGIHMGDFGAESPSSGGMQRPVVSDAKFRLGNASAVAATSFVWPLKSDDPQFTFTKVLQISPQGGVSLPQASGVQLTAWLEIALQSMEGNRAPAAPSNQNIGNHAVIQINGLSGATQIYRPDL